MQRIVGAETRDASTTSRCRARPTARPQIASIGRTEAECARDGLEVKIGKFPFQANGKALIGGDYEGFVKVDRRQGDRRARWAST